MRSLHVLAAAAFLAGCSGSEPTENESPAGGSTVTVSNNAFSPTPIAVALNGTVTWQWNSGGVAHNVTFNDGTSSGNLTSGSFPRTFQAAGSFPYVCTIHAGEGMAGVVNVSASTGGSGGAGDGDGDDGGGSGYP
jgi:plastocyanin